MRKYILLFVLFLIPTLAKAQSSQILGDDLNDLEHWKQEIKNFVIVNDSIVDTSNTYSTDIIYRKLDNLNPEKSDIRLDFSVKCYFDNSSVNNFEIYMIANGNDPENPDFRGFAIATGQKPNYKTLSLIYNEGGNITVLVNTNITLQKSKPRISVTRTASGVWSINETKIYSEPEPRIYQASHILTAFSFTKTGAGKFHLYFNGFDKTIKPSGIRSKIDSAKVASIRTIRIYKNARLDTETSADTKNYTLNGVSPIEIDDHFHYADLIFANDLESGIPLRLRICDIKDLDGIPVDIFEQDLIQAADGQIVINEIMVDLSPAPFALPAKKFVEILNASGYDFDMEGYHFKVGEYDYEFPQIPLRKGEYMILCSSAKDFAQYGPVADILQESRLTVSDKTLILSNKIGSIIDSLTYSTDLYHDRDHQEGGHSMERRDPMNACNGRLNWHASTDLTGGTPGRRNSVHEPYVDTTLAELTSYALTSTSEATLSFSESIRNVSFSINGTDIEDFTIKDNTATIRFPKPLKSGTNKIWGRVEDKCNVTNDNIKLEIDYTPFVAEEAYAVSPYQVIITFSTDLNEVSTNNFRLDDGSIPILAEYTSDGKRNLLLSFADDFVEGKRYSLEIIDLQNSIHETINNRNLKFRHHELQYNDLIINEVLYYPNVGEKRFVELYNNCDDDIFIYGITLRHLSADLKTRKECSVDGFRILRPGQYVVLSADTSAIRNTYNLADNEGITMLQCGKFPAMNTSKGYLSLWSSGGVLLDSMYYANAMQSKLLDNTRGVSLERISFLTSAMDPENWQSASAKYNHATPGFENSCHKSDDGEDGDQPADNSLSNSEISVEHQLFHPSDADDLYTLTFNFHRDNVMVSINIYDDNGRYRRTLAMQTEAYSGFSISWDGYDNSANRCTTGMYIVLITAWDNKGWTKVYKKVAVVGRR